MTLEEYKEYHWDPRDEEDVPAKCPWCRGGWIILEGSLGYECTDCNGTGRRQIEEEELETVEELI